MLETRKDRSTERLRSRGSPAQHPSISQRWHKKGDGLPILCSSTSGVSDIEKEQRMGESSKGPMLLVVRDSKVCLSQQPEGDGFDCLRPIFISLTRYLPMFVPELKYYRWPHRCHFLHLSQPQIHFRLVNPRHPFRRYHRQLYPQAFRIHRQIRLVKRRLGLAQVQGGSLFHHASFSWRTMRTTT